MEYKKDFDKWSKIKQKLNDSNRKVYFHEKEIWWVATGINVGYEQDGKGDMFVRPVLVFKKIRNDMFIGIPITSRLKHDLMHMAFYFEYGLHTMLIFQFKSFDSKRMTQKISVISDYLYDKTKKAVIQFLN